MHCSRGSFGEQSGENSWWETCLLPTTNLWRFDFWFKGKEERKKINAWTEVRKKLLWNIPSGTRGILSHDLHFSLTTGLCSFVSWTALPQPWCPVSPSHTPQKQPQHAMKGVLLWHMPYDPLHAIAPGFWAMGTPPELHRQNNHSGFAEALTWWSTSFFLLCSYILC